VGDDGSLSQQPFSYSGAPGGAIGSDWQVPVLHRSLGANDDWADALLLTAAPNARARGDDVLVNAGGTGYYRVAYSAERVAHLADRLGDLAPLERYNLVSDTWAATLSGHAQVADLLRLAKALADSGEDDPSVWSVVIGALGLFDRIVTDEGRPMLATAVRQLLGSVAASLGWEQREDDDERTPSLRSAVLRTLGTIGADSDVRAEAASRFARREATPLHGDIASAVLDIVATVGGVNEYEAYLAHYRNPSTPQEENRYLDALASFGDEALAARTFELAMTDVRSQNAPFLIRLLLVNREAGPATWERIVAAWDEFPKKFPSNTLPRMLDGVRALCSPPEFAAGVASFIVAHPLAAGGRTVEQILERLAMSVDFGRREGATLAATLADVLGLDG
jgi:puromycin-sensitive aminopeptidase